LLFRGGLIQLAGDPLTGYASLVRGTPFAAGCAAASIGDSTATMHASLARRLAAGRRLLPL